MTRIDEICKAAQNYSDSMNEFERYHTYPRGAFFDGAKWADKTMINKACEWLKKVLYIHTEVNEDKDWCTYNPIDYVTSDFESVEEFIKEFRKAMEE